MPFVRCLTSVELNSVCLNLPLNLLSYLERHLDSFIVWWYWPEELIQKGTFCLWILGKPKYIARYKVFEARFSRCSLIHRKHIHYGMQYQRILGVQDCIIKVNLRVSEHNYTDNEELTSLLKSYKLREVVVVWWGVSRGSESLQSVVSQIRSYTYVAIHKKKGYSTM